MKPTSLIVMARGADADLVRINMPTWLENFLEPNIIFFTPEDDPLGGLSFHIGQAQRIIYGKSAHNGPDSFHRLIRAVYEASLLECTMITEPDTVIIELPEIGENELVGSAIFLNADENFQARNYIHPPWVAGQGTWYHVNEVIHQAYEHGFADRVLGQAMELIQELLTMRAVGWSDNAIDTPAKLVSACESVRFEGAKLIHGVKTLKVRDHLWLSRNQATSVIA